MAKALPKERIPAAKPRRRDWRKAMSDNIAYALLVYTCLQIFVTMQAIKGHGSGSALPYMALVILVAAIIPACRWLERRWEGLSDDQAADPLLRPRFRRDQALLWIMTIGLPFILTAIFRAIGSVF